MARRRAPGTSAGLDTSQVVDAAVATLHDAGLDGLSMRAVAQRLQVAPNAIYSHVRDKDALLDALTDRLLEGGNDDPDAGWRLRLDAVAHHVWATLRKHPDLARRLLGRLETVPLPEIAPAALALEILDHTRIPPAQRPAAVTALMVLSLGMAAVGEAADRQALDLGVGAVLDALARSGR